MALLYEDLSEQLIAGFFEVQNEVGLGRHEQAYHAAYEMWVQEQKLPVRSKPGVPLCVGGREAIVIYPDFVGFNQISIEMKALPRRMGPSEELQLFDYLRARGDRLGVIVNMGLDRVYFERRIYSPPTTTMSEDWSYWTGHISGRDREIGTAIRAALKLVYDSHRTGYSENVTQNLVLTGLASQGLGVVVRPIVQARSSAHRLWPDNILPSAARRCATSRLFAPKKPACPSMASLIACSAASSFPALSNTWEAY